MIIFMDSLGGLLGHYGTRKMPRCWPRSVDQKSSSHSPNFNFNLERRSFTKMKKIKWRWWCREDRFEVIGKEMELREVSTSSLRVALIRDWSLIEGIRMAKDQIPRFLKEREREREREVQTSTEYSLQYPSRGFYMILAKSKNISQLYIATNNLTY